VFLFVTSICILTDIGGYIFGKLIKGPKLTKFSPNKTYAGMFGGYLLSFISIIFISFANFNYNGLNIFIFILIISTVSQLGDIFISYFKRLSKIKDTGKIIPGHGGILDRVDGMIFAFPVAYFIITKF
jgi:phosphatidate cytidylyltransferase